MRLAVDTETTGVDLRHDCQPFFVTMWDGEQNYFWDWDVDPLTRMPLILPEDVEEITERLEEAEELILQNAKFDITAFDVIGVKWKRSWFDKTHDTLMAGHLLATSEPHDLTTMALRYLGVDIQPYEEALHEAVNEARQIARKEFPDWKIARDDGSLPGCPSLKSSGGKSKSKDDGKKLWKWDMWLPKAVAKAKGYPKNHPFWTALANYSNVDSGTTMPVFDVQKELMETRSVWPVYLERRKLIRVINSMETRGVTYSQTRLDERYEEFSSEAKDHEDSCINLSDGKLDKLPKSGTTKALRSLIFDDWKLPIIAFTDTGEPSLNAASLDAWKDMLPARSRQLSFVKNLRAYRKKTTACSYMDGYRRFSRPWLIGQVVSAFRVLYPSLNATGSATLRFTSSNPNEQNISKKDDANLRYCFGPAPGREWWSVDYENLELKLPAYEAGETAMIKLFEEPDAAPYYGSYHLLVSHVLYPKEFEQCLKDGVGFKDRYKATLYQWVKNGNFAVQYGAMEESGTADRAYHMEGAQRRIQDRFKNVAELNRQQIAFANRYGYVLTIKDRWVGSYPIQTPRHFRGEVKPTIPLNYHIQGTAMWAMCKAMVRCQEYLDKLNETVESNFIRQCTAASKPVTPEAYKDYMRQYGYYITMQVHDELVFDFPKPKKAGANAVHMRRLKELMELSGDDLGIPLTVDVSYHPEHWAKSEEIAI